MPTYNYKCYECGHTDLIVHGINEEINLECPKCKEGELKKYFKSSPGISFKGKNFYSNQ